MAKKDEADVYDAPDRFGNQWHTYAPRERAYVKADPDNVAKVHVYVVGSGSVRVLDEADFLEEWAPSAEQRPAEHVA